MKTADTLQGLALARFASSLEGCGRLRLDLEAVWRCFLTAEPALVTDTDKRTRLSAALTELSAAGVIEMPSPRSFDRGKPPLPKFVLVSRRRKKPSGAWNAEFPWRPELSWATAMPMRPRQFTVLKAVNSWLRDGGSSRPVVPARERSLEVFGDEKALEAMIHTNLFGPGRLTWELLRCKPVHAPFVWEQLSTSPVVLAVENHHTFASLRSTLGVGGAVGILAYGAGNHFSSSVAFVADLPQPIRRILYFGDIDPPGLTIPVRASVVAQKLKLPAVEPASSLYRLLLDHGRPALSPTGSLSKQEAARRAAWLPEDLRSEVAALLERGMRLAQEWVGTELLSKSSSSTIPCGRQA